METQEAQPPTDKRYILSIDSGGSLLRAMLFDHLGNIVDRHEEKTPWMSPIPGAQEHDPDSLWETLLKTVTKLIKKSRIKAEEIAALGISNQRASFLLWDKKTGKPISNLISWADVRSANTCDEMNRNPKWRTLKGLAAIVAKISNNPMMKATNMLRFTTDHTTTRLKWFLDTNPGLRARCRNGEILFGTLDTWFIYKLTKGKKHITDLSNVASTGLFNPFQLKWNSVLCNLFNLPSEIFPEVIDTNGNFGFTDIKFFGTEIPIRCAMGDQMAALFGHCCFAAGDVKISQGSGSFVDLNVGSKAKISKRGLFPLIAWSIDGVPTFMLEGYVATAGTLIDWLGSGIGLSSNPKELNLLASLCTDTEGVIVIPSASGIRYPFFNPRTRASILGLSLSTKKHHVSRAVLEGIAFRLIDIISGMEKDTFTKIKSLKTDGGVSNSDILLQSLANYSNIAVARSPEKDMSATGVAYMAGLACGFWESFDDLYRLQQNYQLFEPQISSVQRRKKLKAWNEAIHAIIKIDKIPLMGRPELQK